VSQLNLKENQEFDGLGKVMLLFFVISASPLLYFIFNLILGNEAMFLINGAK
jgi:hypothetical protein